MGFYGVSPAVSIYPGTVGLVLGQPALPGSPVTKSAQTLLASGKSSPIVIAAQPGFHPSTQRQLIWRVFPTGSVNINLQVSVDDVDANYQTIDTYSGSSATVRTITADNSATASPAAQTATKILSAARFIRVVENSGDATATAIVDVTCQ